MKPRFQCVRTLWMWGFMTLAAPSHARDSPDSVPPFLAAGPAKVLLTQPFLFARPFKVGSVFLAHCRLLLRSFEFRLSLSERPFKIIYAFEQDAVQYYRSVEIGDLRCLPCSAVALGDENLVLGQDLLKPLFSRRYQRTEGIKQ